MDTYSRRNSMQAMSQPLTLAMPVAAQNAIASLAKMKETEIPTPAPEGAESDNVDGDRENGPHDSYDEDNALQTFENTLILACHASRSFVTLKIIFRLMQLEAQRLRVELSEKVTENLREIFRWELKDRGKWIEDLEKAQTALTWRTKKTEANFVDMVKSLEGLTVQEG
ncbi:hypothetical protein TWF696_003510 [Orbilia brochopaga]|uniref:Uncharacterized protein n=1 Tax=Orbilia brochopaga TaxID=3140254 RepID=A0AAV9TX53_9PEZI